MLNVYHFKRNKLNYSLCANVQNSGNVGNKQEFIVWYGGYKKGQIISKQLLYER